MDINIDIITAIISQVGFPIFVAVYMLTKSSRESREMRDAISELTTAVKLLSLERSADHE